MGRRALPKIDASISLDRHLFAVEDLEGMFQPDSYFPAEQPLVLEVGCGKGLFLRNSAVGRPKLNFIGIEIAKKYASYCAHQLVRRELSNAIMFQGDGQRFVREHAVRGTFQEVHVYFPDPWWKARHRKRRVLNETIELIPEVTNLRGPLDVVEAAPDHDMDYRTHFERRMRQADKPIYRSLFLKQD